MVDTKTTRMNLVFWYIIFLLALGLFSAFSLCRIQQPVTQDELNWLIAAKTFYADGAPLHLISNKVVTYSPYLYLHSVVAAFNLFGESETVARLPGVFYGLLAIIIVFLIVKSLSKGSQAEGLQWAAISSLLYAVTPAVVQGAVIIDIDNTILVPTILFLYWTFVKYQEKENYTWAMLMGLALSIALWGRITTPPIIVLLLSFYILVSKKAIKTKLIFFCAILAGVFLFVTSWYLYCYSTDIPFLGTFIYTLSSFQGKGHLTLSQLLQNLVCLILWLGIFPSLLFIIFTIQRCISYLKKPAVCLRDIFLWSGIVLVIGYTLVGGAIFGYPKYHIPAIPLLYIYIGITLSQSGLDFEDIRLKVFSIIVVIALAFIVQYMVAGDVLYIFRYTLRNAIAFALPLYPILKNIVLKMSLYSIIFAVTFVICLKTSFKKVWILLLILFSIGTSMGTSLIQSTANYHTGYNYGGEGTIEAAQFIRENVPAQSVVFAPSEIIYYLKLPKSPHMLNPLWTDISELRKRLADKNTSALAYSIATNTTLQVQTISFTKEIQELLHQDFEQTKIKNYTIWIRKNSGDTILK